MRHDGLLLLALVGCAEVPARAPLPGELLITELYTTGAEPAGGTDHYFSDQFVELANASPDPLDLTGVRLADVFGAAGAINSGMEPDAFRSSHPDQVVMSTVWRLPGPARLEPGEALVVAQDGTNHRPFSAVDLSSATWEAFVADSPRDEDHPTVPNLEEVVYNGGYDWLMTVFGPSVVVLDADTPLGAVPSPLGELPTVSLDAVLDGVDTLMDAASGDFKRLPDAVDSGFAWVEGPYSGLSLHRRAAEDGWQDTDHSGDDFFVSPPDPARPEASSEVFGEPTVELGTGVVAFQPLVDAAPLALVAGLQGGWHLDAAVAFGGFGPGGVTLRYEALDAQAERVSFVTEAELFEGSVLEAEDGWHRVGDRIVLDISAPEDVLGLELVLRVTASLGDQTWSDERRITVVEGP